MDDKPEGDDPVLARSDRLPDDVRHWQSPAPGDSKTAQQDRVIAALKLVSDGPD